MHWRGPLASAVVGFSLAALGCDADKPFVEAEVAHVDPGVLHAIEVAGRGDEPSVRGQAPEDTEQPLMVAQAPALPPVSVPVPDPGGVQPIGYTAAHVAATVNGEAILDEELRAAAHDSLRRLEGLAEPERSKRQAEALQEALTMLIEREVVLQEAIERLKAGKNLEKVKEIAEKEFDKTWLRPIKEQFHIKSDDDFKTFLKQQGVTLEMQKRLWERQFMMTQYLQNRVFPITDNHIGHLQIVAYYETHPEAFKVEDEVEWQDIFLATARYNTRDATKRNAEQVAQSVRQGEDFVKLSEKWDDGDSKLRKGVGIGRKRGEIKPAEAEAALFQLKQGEVTVVEKLNGFHVLRVVKRQYAGSMPFDEKTQKLIKDKLRNEIMQREMKRIVTELKRKAVIEVCK